MGNTHNFNYFSGFNFDDDMFQQMVEVSNAGIFILNTSSIIVYANDATAKLFNLSINELIGMDYYALIPPSELSDSKKKISDKLSSGGKEIVSHRRLYKKPDGEEFLGHITGSVLFDRDDRVIGLITILVDVSVEIEKEKQLKLLAGVFTYTKEAAVISNKKGMTVEVNSAFTEITGYNRDETVGFFPKMLRSNLQNYEFYDEITKEVITKGFWKGEMWGYRKNGELYSMLITVSEIKYVDENGLAFVSLFSDISKMKEREKALEKMIHFDSETGLPNRFLLTEKVDELISNSSDSNDTFAIALVDVDSLNEIGVQFGGDVESRLFTILTDRLQQAIIEPNTLSRIAGEQFVALFPNVSSDNVLYEDLERLMSAICEPIPINDLDKVSLNGAIGVSVYKNGVKLTAEELLKQAGRSMYLAILEGKNQIRFFSDTQNQLIIERNEMRAEIKRAIENDEFVLFYQPKVNMVTGKILGFEALIRWQHPVRGLMQPNEFLPYTLDHPLSVMIDDWVINEALKQMQIWARDGIEIYVSVNAGALKFEQSDFVDFIRTKLSEYPLVKPSNFGIEILESTSIQNMDAVPDMINACKNLGVHIALDDFGAGYASLTYLRLLPADLLKIDQSFVREVLFRPNDLIILECIISLANAFGRDIIAEGVETTEHGTLLIRLGCTNAQGYSISKPIPAHMVPSWISEYRPNPKWLNKKPLDRKYVPAILSEVEHRSWVENIKSSITSNTCFDDMIDEKKCRFYSWIQKELKDSPLLYNELKHLSDLHVNVHKYASKFCIDSSLIPNVSSPIQDDNIEFKQASHKLLEELEVFFEKLSS